ncbi:hypothetical protein P692DRAFT_20870347 [Suillus brevipes Sb2]|nr:hypothetical protein P692DRAFT_20870347 [Suillus brevipes Sb2]
MAPQVPATLPLPSSLSQLSAQPATRFDQFATSSPPLPSNGVVRSLRQYLSFLVLRHNHGPPVVEVALGRNSTRLAAANCRNTRKLMILDIWLTSIGAKRSYAIIPVWVQRPNKSTRSRCAHGLMNVCERTFREWESPINRDGCGLRITNVYPLRALTSLIECALEDFESVSSRRWLSCSNPFAGIRSRVRGSEKMVEEPD